MKVLVTGGRAYTNRDHLRSVLDRTNQFMAITAIIHGCAGGKDKKTNLTYGADLMAGEWAVDNKIKEIRYPANWTKYGKGAGLMRNFQMLDYEHPQLVIAFPGSTGTKHMVENALLYGIDVLDSTTLKVTQGKKQNIDLGDLM